jgi:hypothetical protein
MYPNFKIRFETEAFRQDFSLNRDGGVNRCLVFLGRFSIGISFLSIIFLLMKF